MSFKRGVPNVPAASFRVLPLLPFLHRESRKRFFFVPVTKTSRIYSRYCQLQLGNPQRVFFSFFLLAFFFLRIFAAFRVSRLFLTLAQRACFLILH